MAKLTKKKKKGMRKKFFVAEIPLTATKVHVYGYSPEEMEGNIVKIDLTKSMRGKNVELRAKLKADGENLSGELLSLKILPVYIRRIMRRGVSYIEDSFDIDCKDAKLRIKPFMLTRKKVSRAIKTEIRNTSKKHLEGKMKIRNTSEIFSEIMANKLQKELSLKIKKIYPLGLCEIRTIEIIGKVSPKKEDAEKEAKKE
jgi:ribosomal protein S3AE|tara:strand:- start:70 stop:666 length:597 start_codon:yes stop_codon:yes gene_type:complete